ncbi:MAG: cell division protein FtsH, partial [Syntrophobacteraceae bacterium]|nr:cell division protein FtsH [Syntrophobacteraceae bacterium]
MNFSIWYFLAAVLMLMLFQSYLAEPQRDTIPYSRFKQLVQEDKVFNLVLSSERIRGELKDEKTPGRPFVTIR